MMKLKSLIPLREVTESKEVSQPELAATAFFNEFSSKHNCSPLWKFIGTKGECNVFCAEVDGLGAMSLVITEAKLVAKVEEKSATFGVVYTTTGLQEVEHPICSVKCTKEGYETIPFDSKDKQNFSASKIKFTNLITK